MLLNLTGVSYFFELFPGKRKESVGGFRMEIFRLGRRHSKQGTKSSFTSSSFFLDSIEITYPYTNLPGLPMLVLYYLNSKTFKSV